MAYRVFAAEEGNGKVKPSELPIYPTPPEETKYEYVEENISAFRENVSTVRRKIWDYLGSIKSTTDMIQDKYETGKAHTQNTIYWLQNDPGLLPRAGVITVAGLGGIVAGYKGGPLRKAFFGTIAATSAASLCYPKEAVDVTRRGYNRVIYQARDIMNLPQKPEPSTPMSPTLAPQTTAQKAPKGYYSNEKVVEEEECEHCKDEHTQSETNKPPSKNVVAPLTASSAKVVGDKGQSKDEDKDMYTTRS